MSAVDVQQSPAVPTADPSSSLSASSDSSHASATAASTVAASSLSSSSRRSELSIRFGDATKDNWQQVRSYASQ